MKKSIKIYLIIVTVLLVVALGFGVYVWYTLQKLNVQVQDIVPNASQKELPKSDTPTKTTSTQTVTKPITVETKTLTETQQKTLKTFGYNKDTFTITPQMVTCAEEAVGKSRLDEIMKGSAPSPLESVKLLPCFKA